MSLPEQVTVYYIIRYGIMIVLDYAKIEFPQVLYVTSQLRDNLQYFKFKFYSMESY